MDLLTYYSQEKVQKLIAKACKDKEVGLQYSDKGFGKRPDIIQYESDVLEVAKQGVTSFHISEEHFRNPLLLKSGMSKKELNNLRTGFDIILDIDSPNLEYSKITTNLLIEALKFHDIKNIGLKYSGNRGFHIGIPFNALPDEVNKIKTKELFPDSIKVLANYLSMFIKPHLEKISEEKKIDIKHLLTIDDGLISSRHMYRAPYSINEKSGLVSVVINLDELNNFNKEQAKPENIKEIKKFLDYSKTEKNEAAKLIIQAFDWDSKIKNRSEESKTLENNSKLTSKKYDEIKEAIPEKFFPPTILKGLKGLNDGKKRFLFILLNFLRCLGWSYESIEERIKEWNEKNPQPLKEGYIKSQIIWHKRNKENKLPPNFPHASGKNNYYKELGIWEEDDLSRVTKNPVQYTIRKSKFKK